MRVLLVISNLEYGGAQRQVVALANHLGAVGFDTHVCTLSDYVPLATDLINWRDRLHIIPRAIAHKWARWVDWRDEF